MVDSHPKIEMSVWVTGGVEDQNNGTLHSHSISCLMSFDPHNNPIGNVGKLLLCIL